MGDTEDLHNLPRPKWRIHEIAIVGGSREDELVIAAGFLRVAEAGGANGSSTVGTTGGRERGRVASLGVDPESVVFTPGSARVLEVASDVDEFVGEAARAGLAAGAVGVDGGDGAVTGPQGQRVGKVALAEVGRGQGETDGEAEIVVVPRVERHRARLERAAGSPGQGMPLLPAVVRRPMK